MNPILNPFIALDRFVRISAAVSALFYLSSCSLFQGVTRYDPVTYKNFTDLKPELGLLYDSFAVEGAPDQEKIAAFRLKLDQMVEYEKGKGEKNVRTARQVENIQKLFERHVEDRTRGTWNPTHLGNQKQTILEALDLAIETEQTKNK